MKQQSFQLFHGVASGRISRKNKQGLFLACLVYGTLCRVQETAIFFGCFLAWRLAG
jgi:hypothetical protein